MNTECKADPQSLSASAGRFLNNLEDRCTSFESSRRAPTTRLISWRRFCQHQRQLAFFIAFYISVKFNFDFLSLELRVKGSQAWNRLLSEAELCLNRG